MKYKRTPLLAGMVGLMFTGFTLETVSADFYREINRQARRIDSQAAGIARETRHFQHTPFYNCLVNDTQHLRQVARHIRDHARSGYCLIQLQQNVASLGNAYRVLEGKFQRVEWMSPGCRQARRVRERLNSIQFEIREMFVTLSALLRSPCAKNPSAGGIPLVGSIPAGLHSGWANPLGASSVGFHAAPFIDHPGFHQPAFRNGLYPQNQWQLQHRHPTPLQFGHKNQVHSLGSRLFLNF